MQQLIENKDEVKFISETKYFLDEFDSIIGHWDLSGNFFLHYLLEIHEGLTQLLSKFTTLSLEGVGGRKHENFFNLQCCGTEFHSVDDLRLHHHSCCHKKSTFGDTDNCELKSALFKLAFFNRRVNEYLLYGTVADRYLCLYLKKILKKPLSFACVACLRRPSFVCLLSRITFTGVSGKVSFHPELRRKVSEMILEDTVMYLRSAKTPEDVAKWKLVYNFIIETKYFLEHYDSIVETWDLCDKEFMILMWQVEELLTDLLYKYTTVSTEFLRPVSLPTVEIKCCNIIFEKPSQLNRHYYTVHHTPGRLNDVRYCEMKAGLLKLDFYRRSMKYYLEFGTWADHVLCLYLKRIYKKVNHTLDPFREAVI